MIIERNKNNIFIIGPTGSGKSSIGIFLSKKLNITFFDSDLEIEKHSNTNINNLFKNKGEKEFRKLEKLIIKNILDKNKNIILSTGAGIIKSEYLRKLLCNTGIVIYLKVNIKTQISRLNNINNRPLLNYKNKYEKINILKKMNKNRNELYEIMSDIIIDTNNKKIIEIVDNIIHILNINNFIINEYENNKC